MNKIFIWYGKQTKQTICLDAGGLKNSPCNVNENYRKFNTVWYNN